MKTLFRRFRIYLSNKYLSFYMFHLYCENVNKKKLKYIEKPSASGYIDPYQTVTTVIIDDFFKQKLSKLAFNVSNGLKNLTYFFQRIDNCNQASHNFFWSSINLDNTFRRLGTTF